MTTKDIDKRIKKTADSRRQTAAKKAAKPTRKKSAANAVLNWIKPYIVPFILGAMFGGIVTHSAAVCRLPSAVSQTTLEQKAAWGGAAIPFPSGNPSPNLSSLPPNDWKAEATAGVKTSMCMSTCELPLPSNPQADNGQGNLPRLWRPLLRRTQ